MVECSQANRSSKSEVLSSINVVQLFQVVLKYLF